MILKHFKVFIGVIFIVQCHSIYAQTNTTQVVTSAVPFLRIPVDARCAGMGDIGVATSPDNFSDYHNPAKYAFMDDRFGVSINYSPWLRQLVTDIHLISANGFVKIDNMQSFAASLRYFSLGKIDFTDQLGNPIITANPNELTFSAHYARKFSSKLSLGVSLRYVFSNLAAGLPGNTQAKAGHAGAGDISLFYRTKVKMKGDMRSRLNWGLNISNIGNKMLYTSSTAGDYLPANFATGVGYELDIDKYNTVNFGFEINKLMVPTPDTARSGGDPNVYDYKEKGVIGSIFSSWGDAPGGFGEEMKEFTYGLGAEYIYNKLFSVRAGYFYEAANKGGRNFLTAGLGLRYNVFNFYFSYLIPTSSTVNPLDNTMRFSMVFNFGNKENEESAKSKNKSATVTPVDNKDAAPLLENPDAPKPKSE